MQPPSEANQSPGDVEGAVERGHEVRLGTDVRVNQESRELSVQVTDRLAALTQIIGSLREENITAEDITVRRPTLDDAFCT